VSEIRGLTIRQPWAGAITHGPKRIENRSWTTPYRGLIAIHAGAGVGARWEWEDAVDAVADLSGLPMSTVESQAKTRSAVVAVARLAGVCSGSFYSDFVECDCGPWAVPGQRHLALADVRPLAEPVPAKGALSLWCLPDDVEAAVRLAIGDPSMAATREDHHHA
jgi:hypothetical protein